MASFIAASALAPAGRPWADEVFDPRPCPPDCLQEFELHDLPLGCFDLPGAEVTAALVFHPGPTVGFRLGDGTATLCYLPDHEPALGVRRFPQRRD